MDGWVTVHEAARAAGLDIFAVYHRIYSGKLRCRRERLRGYRTRVLVPLAEVAPRMNAGNAPRTPPSEATLDRLMEVIWHLSTGG